MSTKLQLLPDERVVMTSDGDILTLTNRRVRYDSVVFGNSSIISITLDSIASCGLVTRAYPILLLLAGIALIAALSMGGGTRSALLILAAVFAAGYFSNRRSVISIASKGGHAITVPTRGMSRQSAVEFLDAVEREKLR